MFLKNLKMSSPRNLGNDILAMLNMLNIFNMFNISPVWGFGSGYLAGARLMKDWQNIYL